MTDVSYGAQTVQIRNPLVPLAIAQLVTGSILTLPAAVCLARIQPALSGSFLAGQFFSARAAVLLLFGGTCAFWLARGISYIWTGVQKLGPRLIVSVRTPLDFESIDRVEPVLVRQEFRDLRLPTDGILVWIQRFQRDRVFYATPRERILLQQSVEWVFSGLRLVALLAVVLFLALPIVRAALPPRAVGTLLWIAAAIVASATLRGLAIPLLLPNHVPIADRDEHMRMVRGGGDPALLLPMVEQDFMRLREGVTPNRSRPEIKTSRATVADTGEYKARMYVETQPLPEPPITSPLTWLYLGGGIAFSAVGMTAAVLGLLGGSLSSVSSSTLVAGVWTAIGIQLIASGRRVLSRYRYSSTIAFLKAEGTIGRSEVKAGKGWNDSFESANLVVRSDSTMRLYAAALTTETYEVEGPRYIIRADRDSKSNQAMQVLNGTVDAYERAGIVVRPIETIDGGLNQLAQANLAYRQATAAISPTSPTPPMLVESGGAPSGFQLQASSPAPASAPSEDSRACPMCAEIIKAAARKCRFCGHLLEA